jgi:hexulose-6-phosphate isomerase
MTIGIMQGRLVPSVGEKIQAFPGERWAEEFPQAAAAGLGCIEWVYDLASESTNPLGSDGGIARIKELATRHGVAVRSVCADYFMDQPLIRVTNVGLQERLQKLEWLLGQCRQVGIARVVLPFVDQSAIRTPAEAEQAQAALRRVLPVAERCGVELHLETALGPEAFRAFLAALTHPRIKVNYDSGNSASLGYRAQEEFAAYGERIGSVHIKDRVRGGGTVPLGTGDAALDEVFAGLRRLGYRGDFILQVARGAPGDELAWARQNRAFVEHRWGAA